MSLLADGHPFHILHEGNVQAFSRLGQGSLVLPGAALTPAFFRFAAVLHPPQDLHLQVLGVGDCAVS